MIVEPPKKYIPAKGFIGSKIMLLTDCPTWGDHENGELYSDKIWNETKVLLRDAGIPIDSCWRSAVSKYFVPPSPSGKSDKKIPFAIRAKNAGVDLHVQINELQEEINAINPNVIIALGRTPLWVLTGNKSIEDYRGSILQGMGRKVIPTYNPCHLQWQARDVEFTGYYNRNIIQFDLKRAAFQSTFPDFKLPQRSLSIANNSYALYEFIQRYKNHTRPAVDIEARGACIPFCIGIAFTPWEGICMPLWNTGEIESLFTIYDNDLVTMWLLMAELLANSDVIGQNFKYDEDKIKRLGFIVRSLASDTMLKGFAINPELPKRLGFLTSIYTEEPFYKNEGMYEGKLQDLLLGCARDACVTKEVDGAMESDLDDLNVRAYYEHFIISLHQLYLDAETTGFRVDEAKRDQLFRKYIAWDERCRYELFGLTGEYINVNSAPQVKTLLYSTLGLPAKAGTSEEDITALLNTQKIQKDKRITRILELILETRRVRKTVSTYLMAIPDYDGRMKTTFYICNETGRSSTGQQDPPIRPQIEVLGEDGKKKNKNLGIAFQTMTKHGDIGEDVREQYIPDSPDEILVQLDSAQAEARVVFLLADDEQALIDIDAHDYHALTASWFFGGTEDDYSKKKLGYESPIRFAGKTLRHAGHLGAGKRRAAISVNTDARKYKIPISITEVDADRALKIFHQKQPKIQQVFHYNVVESLKRNRQLRASVPYGVDAAYGPPRQFFERWGDELFRMAFSYIPQRSITDNTKAAALRIKREFKKEAKLIVEAHDGLLWGLKQSLLADFLPIAKHEMERPIRFENCSISRRDLVVPCDVEVGYNYRELTKYKGTIATIIETQELRVTEKPNPFVVVDVPNDTQLDNRQYNDMEWKKIKRSFIVDEVDGHE